MSKQHSERPRRVFRFVDELGHRRGHGDLPCCCSRGVLLLQLDQCAGRAGAALVGGRASVSASATIGCTRIADTRPPSRSSISWPSAARLTLEGGPIFWVATHRVAPSAFRSRRRSAHAARWRVLGAHGVDPVRRHPSQRHGADGAIRARPRARSVLSLAEHVSLRAAHGRRVDAARGRRLAAWSSGASSCASSFGLHGDVAGELGDAHVGHAAASRRATIRATAGGSRC